TPADVHNPLFFARSGRKTGPTLVAATRNEASRLAGRRTIAGWDDRRVVGESERGQCVAGHRAGISSGVDAWGRNRPARGRAGSAWAFLGGFGRSLMSRPVLGPEWEKIKQSASTAAPDSRGRCPAARNGAPPRP